MRGNVPRLSWLPRFGAAPRFFCAGEPRAFSRPFRPIAHVTNFSPKWTVALRLVPRPEQVPWVLSMLRSSSRVTDTRGNVRFGANVFAAAHFAAAHGVRQWFAAS